MVEGSKTLPLALIVPMSMAMVGQTPRKNRWCGSFRTAVASHCLYCVSGLSLHRSTRRCGQCNVRQIPGRLEVGARNLDLRQLDRHRGTREDREVPALSIQTHHREKSLMTGAISWQLKLSHGTFNLYATCYICTNPKGSGCLAERTRIASL